MKKDTLVCSVCEIIGRLLSVDLVIVTNSEFRWLHKNDSQYIEGIAEAVADKAAETYRIIYTYK